MDGMLGQDEWDGKEAGRGVRAKLMGSCVLRFPGLVLPNVIATAIKKTHKPTNQTKKNHKTLPIPLSYADIAAFCCV